MSSVGVSCCGAIDESGVNSVLLTTRPKNKNLPVTFWMNFLPALSSGGKSLGRSAYCAFAPY